IVLEGVTEGENRARITSSAITGLYFLGDDLSESGDSITKERVKNFLTNPGINQMARECKSFRPVEIGHEDKATDSFYYLLSDTMYLAVFNFDEIEKQKTIDFSRLGLDSDKKFLAKELWSGEYLEFVNDLNIDISPKDVKVFKISI
ncbi:MAG: alpha-galactosidase, partial [Muribaculaceae bacterium]|nr:alpha-galactosidase [Muribaculaceae bacterium]